MRTRMRTALFTLFFLLFLVGCENRSNLITNVTERDANEIIVLLNSNGIEATKVAAAATGVGGTSVQMWTISVPPDRLKESLSLLNQAGLPRVKGTNLLDLFGSPGLVPSELQDRIRYQEGLSEQLANTIRKMDCVLDADVQITFPKEGEEVPQPLTASVYIKHRGGSDATANLLVGKIKRLVASAIPGLKLENVSVVSDRAGNHCGEIKTCEEISEGGIGRMVSIWGIEMSAHSAARFRFIFYFFILLLFLLICALVWTLWKIYPLIEYKKYRSFFLAQPWTPTDFTTPPPEERIET